MIDADHLVKRYGGHIAVDDVSFTCRPGTVTGFLGPNGAGKSTTLRMMTGLTPPTAGRVTIDGVPYAAHPNPGRVVGVMLDASAQHPGRTGHRDAAPRRPAARHAARTRPTRCSSASASAEPGASGSATTRSACASASASARPCSATRRC